MKRDEIENNDIMNRIRDYHKKLEKVIGNDQYVSNESDFELFLNEDVLDPREEAYKGLRETGHEEPYQEYDLPVFDDVSPDTDDRENKDIFDSYLEHKITIPE